MNRQTGGNARAGRIPYWGRAGISANRIARQSTERNMTPRWKHSRLGSCIARLRRWRPGRVPSDLLTDLQDDSRPHGRGSSKKPKPPQSSTPRTSRAPLWRRCEVPWITNLQTSVEQSWHLNRSIQRACANQSGRGCKENRSALCLLLLSPSFHI